MEVFLIFLFFAGVLLIIGSLFVLAKNNISFLGTASDFGETRLLEKASMKQEIRGWNEGDVHLELVKLQNNPPLFRHFVESIKARFIENQNSKTAITRLAYLEQEIKGLEFANQYEDLRNSLKLKKLEFENTALKRVQERQEIEITLLTAEQRQELQSLEAKRRLNEKTVDIARLEKEYQDLLKPPQEEKKLTAKEIRKEKKKNLEKRIKKMKKLIEEVKTDAGLSGEERQRSLNQLERKLVDLQEELYDLL